MAVNNAPSLMIRCKSCGWVFSPTPGSRPPWCPHCGADLKAEPADRPPGTVTPEAAPPEQPRPPEAPPPVAEASSGTAPPRQPLPYFQACRPPSWSQDRCLYRVYVTGTDLLFIALGTGGHAQAAGCAAMGGAVGGLVGAAVVWHKQKQMERRGQLLDAADEPALRQLAEEEKNSFRAAVADLHDVRIDPPPSVWSRLFRGSAPCVGQLRLAHAQRGAMTLELPTPEDVRVALAELRRLFGPAVQTSLTWRSF